MKEKPPQEKIDVIIPVYNGEKYITPAIESVLAQTHPPQNIYIVDDGSMDNTAQIVKKLAANSTTAIHYIFTERRGPGVARNTAIKQSNADFMAFMDADDVWLPKKLEKQIALIKNNQEIGFVHCRFNHVDENLNLIKEFLADKDTQELLSGDTSQRIFYGVNFISCPSVLVNRNLLLKAGLFDESFFYAEDLDLWIRLSKITPFGLVTECMVLMRRHGENMTLQEQPMRIDMFKYYNKWLPSFPDDTPDLKRLRKEWAYLTFKRKDMRKIISTIVSKNALKKVFPYTGGNIYLQIFCYLPLWAVNSFKRRLKEFF